jgi:tetratricopeptide (TPR) repeat protein
MKRYPPRSLALVVSVLLLAAVAGCSSPQERHARALAKGDQYLAAGNIEKASVEYRNALQLAPNDAQSRFKTGVVLEKQGNVREAAKFYQGALEVDADQVAARTALARVYLFGGVPDRALDTLKPGLEKHPDDAEMLAVRAAVRIQQRDADGALEDALHAFRSNPKSENVVAVLAGIYAARGDGEKAQGLLATAVKEHPKSIDVRLALASLYAKGKESAKAEALLREVVGLAPTEHLYPIRLAQFLNFSGKPADAEAVLREALVRMPKSRELHGSLLGFLTTTRGRPAAEAELIKWTKAASRSDFEPRFELATFYEQGKESAKAEAVYLEIVKADGTGASGLTARNHLASLALAKGDKTSAAKYVAEVLASNPRDSEALVTRGTIALRGGDAKNAIVDLRAALRDHPNAVGVLRELARAHIANHELPLAEETLRRAVDANPLEMAPRLDLVGVLFDSGKPEEAKTILGKLTKEFPKDFDVQQTAFRASAAAKDFSGARAAASAIQEIRPTEGYGHYLLGLVAEGEGKIDEALKEYDAALLTEQPGAEALPAATRLLVQHRRVPEALSRLEAVSARQPKNPLPESLKGEILATEHHYPEAVTALEAAIARAPDWWIPYRTLAAVSVQKGDRAAAAALLTQALPKVTEPNRLRSFLAGVYSGGGQFDDAIRVHEDMLKQDPKDLIAANNLAMLLVTHKSDAASLARATALVAGFADSSFAAYLDTYGWVKLKSGDPKGALGALTRAQAAAPTIGVIRYHLGAAQAANGLRTEAIASLKAALAAGGPFDGDEDARTLLKKLAAGA